MVRWVVVAALCCATGAARAQTVMDGTDKAIGEANLISLRRAFLYRLNDPYGAQLIELKNVGPDKVCGRVNAKNSYGGLIGFRLFGADLRSGKVAIQPNPSTDSATKEDLERSLAELKAIKATCED